MIIMRLLNALAPASTIPSSVLVDLALWGLGSDLSELRVVQPVLRLDIYINKVTVRLFVCVFVCPPIFL